MGKIPLVLGLGALLLPVLGLGWYTAAQAPVDPKGQEELIVIGRGRSTRQIAQALKEDGFIRSELAFLINAKLRNDLLQAGVYRLSPAMRLFQIVDKLARGDVAEYLVTVPEGWRNLEITQLLERLQIVQKNDFLTAAEDEEGYLFPDTYRFPLGVTVDAIISDMRDNFNARTKDINLTRNDIILASIVEREAQNDDDRAKIAAVYLNRLRLGMRLEADPTVQYAKTLVDSSITEPWPKITVADYRSVESPYNTYLNDGLPPGPICNPGLASLKAVLAPASIDDLYFFHTADGQLILSKTLDEHNVKKSQYDLAN